MKTILVTGGAGYVGSVLVPQMLAKGYKVKVLDLYLFGNHVLDSLKSNTNLEQVRGDIRDPVTLESVISDCDAVIHLACISNDPSFELNPALGKAINYDAFEPLVRAARENGVRRFIYASSSSVYGIKDDENVTEDMSLEPLTDYSKYKALCEDVLLRYQAADFTTVVVRPATVCGYSPRQRLDVIVNILTNHAINTGVIKVLGGQQKRPNIHIQDMVDLYLLLLEAEAEKVAGRVYNVGCENHTVRQLADIVRNEVGQDKVDLVTVPTNDNRSYHISSEKLARELGFRTKHTVGEAVRDLAQAFAGGRLPDPMHDMRYYNIETMKALNLL